MYIYIYTYIHTYIYKNIVDIPMIISSFTSRALPGHRAPRRGSGHLHLRSVLGQISVNPGF